MSHSSRRLPLFAAVMALAALAMSSGHNYAAQPPQQSQVATVALLDFRGSGVGRNAADFAALGAAIPHHLGFVLASNPNIRLVDRNRIQEIIREQDLGAAGRLDSSTMVRVGRILGARYIIDGSFIIQDNGQMAISTTSRARAARSTSVSSSAEPGSRLRRRRSRSGCASSWLTPSA